MLKGAPIKGAEGYRVARFVEKPSLKDATKFVTSGSYAWNSGIFAFRAGAYLEALALHRPALADRVRQAVAHGSIDGAKFCPEVESFAQIDSESVDYAVMENTDRAAMVLATMGWSDIGDWHALHQARRRDASNNSVTGAAELLNCRGLLVDTDGPKVSVIGVSDIIVVVDKDQVLITHANDSQLVGKLKGALHQ